MCVCACVCGKIRSLEKMKLEIISKQRSIVFNTTCLNIYIYIYTYQQRAISHPTNLRKSSIIIRLRW